MLFRAGANAGEQDGFIRKAEAFGQWFGDERGLIVAALAFAAAMERNGHDHVNAGPPRTAISASMRANNSPSGSIFSNFKKRMAWTIAPS